MKKYFRYVALCLVLSIFMSNVSLAVSEDAITLSNASDAFVQTSHTSDLDTDTGLYIYAADVIAKSGATSTYVSCVIQRRENGEFVNVPGAWLSDSQSGFAAVGGQRYVYKGYWYRTQATYIVHINGQEYKIVNNSDQYWYN